MCKVRALPVVLSAFNKEAGFWGGVWGLGYTKRCSKDSSSKLRNDSWQTERTLRIKPESVVCKENTNDNWNYHPEPCILGFLKKQKQTKKIVWFSRNAMWYRC